MNKRIGILTGGGDTQPLNAVIFFLRGLLQTIGADLIGFMRGWEGILSEQCVKLNNVPDFSGIGGTILKSSRVNLANEDGFDRANRILSRLELDALVVIGGDDTLSNIYGIKTTPCIGISKTIDNDVGAFSIRSGKIQAVNYFTLGYPTAADKIARMVSLEEGLRTTAYSHERIVIVESMGMHAGWLAMASAFGNPDFILIPEFPLDYNRFCVRLKERYSKNRHAVVVVAEGAKLDEGGYMHTDPSEKDPFGHSRFGGSSRILQNKLKADLKGFMDVRNINAVNPSYFYRSGAANPTDRLGAENLSQLAFQLICGGVQDHQFAYIDYSNSVFTALNCPFSEFPQTKNGHFPKRFVNNVFYNPETYSGTKLWEEYLGPIVMFRASTVNYLLKNER